MSRAVVLGAGIAGRTAAAFLRRWLPRHDEVVVVSPKPHYNWIPSNIWVGVGLLAPERVVFPLAPVYESHGIEFHQASALALHPEGDETDPSPFVEIASTKTANGSPERLRYDFLVNATGPKLNFAATKGLGPEGHSVSVCTDSHAVAASRALDVCVDRMRRGERLRFLVGTGIGRLHPDGALNAGGDVSDHYRPAGL